MDLNKSNQPAVKNDDTPKSDISSDDELLTHTFKDAINNKKFSKEYIKMKVIAFLNKLKIIQFMTTNTSFCKHNHSSSFQYALEGFLTGFKKAYMLKVVVAFLFMLTKRKLSNFLLSENTLRFALFPALFSFIYRGVLSYLRHVRGKEDGYNSIIASILGGAAMFMDNDRNRRYKIALYTGVRSFQTLVELGDRRGVIKKFPDAEILTYSLSTLLPVYLYHYDRAMVPKGAYSGLNAISNQRPNFLKLVDVWEKQGVWRYS